MTLTEVGLHPIECNSGHITIRIQTNPNQFIRSVNIASCYVICEDICIVGIGLVMWHNFTFGFFPPV